MGFELKLNVCSNIRYFVHDGEAFYNPDYMIDLYNPGYGSVIYDISKEYLIPEASNVKPDIIWYRYEGNDNKVTKDMYNSYPVPCPIGVAIAALEQDVENGDYRRFGIALNILQEIRSYFPYAKVFFEGH